MDWGLTRNPQYYSLDLDIKIWLRVCKVTGAFEKGDPAQFCLKQIMPNRASLTAR